MNRILLSGTDYKSAVNEAKRQLSNREKYGRSRDHGGFSNRTPEQRLADGIVAFLGEIAACRHLGVEWKPGGDEITKGDCDGHIEARATDHPRGGLLIYPKDNDESPIILVRGKFPYLDVYPAIYIKEGKKVGVWREDFHPPCWSVDTYTIEKIGFQINKKKQSSVEQIRSSYWLNPGDETLQAALSTCEWRINHPSTNVPNC